MTDTLTILTAARNIIADPAMWYQGGWTASGEWNTDEPCCAMGAIRRAASTANANVQRFSMAMHVEKFTPACVNLIDFNDAHSTTHADVLAVFDRAIAAMEDKP